MVITQISARQLSLAIHRREVSCREVMQAYLAQIERHNPKHNAIINALDPEVLLSRADERDAQLSQGHSMAWMHGMPIAIKDLAATADIPTTQGSPLLRDFRPSEDSAMVARIRRAGAIVIGKTNVPEFGLGSHSFNELFGTTCNAYDTSKTAGGSSGGAAVALALRMLPVADGSDFMGSLRNPAGWNNIVSLRPCVGRIPGNAREVWLPTMSTMGPMGRSVTDVALLFSAMVGEDPADPATLEADARRSDYAAGLSKTSLKGVTLAVARFYTGDSPRTDAVFEQALNAGDLRWGIVAASLRSSGGMVSLMRRSSHRSSGARGAGAGQVRGLAALQQQPGVGDVDQHGSLLDAATGTCGMHGRHACEVAIWRT